MRVVTVMCGSADKPMFGKPGGQMRLPEISDYYNVQDTAYKEQKVQVLANKLVKDFQGGARGTIWHGTLFSTWLVDTLINAERGLKQVKR